jgi:hypothetical protein
VDTSCGSASCPWPAITHSCTAPDGSYGDPGVRTAQFAGEFGFNGLQFSICNGSFGTALDRVARQINQVLGPSCIPGPIGLNAAGQPDCTVVEQLVDSAGRNVTATVQSCTENNNTAPCWQLGTDASCPGQVLNVSPDPNLPSSYQPVVTYDCAK